MSHSTLVTAQLNEPLRAYALTVEEAGPGEFKWRILENHGAYGGFESVCCAETTFAAYDTALATGYGELQRLIGPDLQFGPRREPHARTERVTSVAPTSASALNAARRVAALADDAQPHSALGNLLGEAEIARA
jgi:hypothetical protein